MQSTANAGVSAVWPTKTVLALARGQLVRRRPASARRSASAEAAALLHDLVWSAVATCRALRRTSGPSGTALVADSIFTARQEHPLITLKVGDLRLGPLVYNLLTGTTNRTPG